MRLPLAAVALLLALVVTGCESGSDGDPLEAARYLNPEAQLVAAIDLDYEGDQWLQLKRLYARVAGESLSREVFGTQLPATLDGGLETLARARAASRSTVTYGPCSTERPSSACT